MNLVVLIPAAGMGRRMGSSVNKQYLMLRGRPVLAHTLSVFQSHPRVSRIIVVSPKDEIAYCRARILAPYGFDKVSHLVPGGTERQDSVRNGLFEGELAAQDLVLIHDGARPLLHPRYIDALARRAGDSGACVLAVRAKDTIIEVEQDLLRATPERSRLWQVQTPQAFRAELILEAHRRAFAEGFSGTDDASLVRRLGSDVGVLEGDYRNIKITTPEDLALAVALLELGQNGEETCA